MKVYTAVGRDGTELAHPINDSDFETLYLLPAGKPLLPSWSQVPMHLVRFEHDGSFLVASDAPWLGSHALVLKKGAVDAMRPILDANGELLPVQSEDTPLHLFNATRIVDALDESASAIVRFRDSQRVMRITKYAFRAAALANVDCFRIPQLRVSPIFMSERFIDAWSAARLTGLNFELVWNG
jgi:hypothetical protein